MHYNRHCRLRGCALAVALACAGPALSQADPQLRDIVVTATRVEADADRVPATITTIDRQRLQRRLPADEADLLRDEPDLSFARDARRFGATRPNIRGLEDNRVMQLVDGVRMPDYYNAGGPTNFTMSAPLAASTNFLKRVEILRGPASALYGSDALGGVVGFLTLDAGDILMEGATLGALTRLGYTGSNSGLTGTVLGAGRGANGLQWVLGYSHTQAQEFDNFGLVDTVAPSRTKPNPQDVTDRGVLAKLALRPAPGHRLAFTLDAREQDADVVIKRLSSDLPTVTLMEGDDHTQRLRASLEWQHQPAGGWYDRLTTRLHHQVSDTENHNRQTRRNTSAGCAARVMVPGVNTCHIEQDFFFEQTRLGGGAQVEKTTGAHFLTVGVDLSRVETLQMRDVRVWNLTTGGIPGVTTPGKVLAGDTFPLRDFAPGHTDSAGLFVQDEIAMLDQRLTLTPGLRYDWRRLRPEPDALSLAVLAANSRQAVTQTDGALSPRLAALWRLDAGWAVFGHVARGFRAPNYEEVNGHFRNTAMSYGISPNPDLKPETSVGVEAGLRLSRPGLRGQIAIYDNRYDDFIESVRLNCPADRNCIAGLTFTNMAVNLAKVRIRGAEARLTWDLRPGWRLSGALAYAHGQDEERDQPLNSIEPTRMSLALAREAGVWGGELRLRAAERVKRVNDSVGATRSPWFRPPGYGVADLSVWWSPSQRARLVVAANNLFDKKHWLWSDIRQADARNPVGVDFYTQPGRHLSASVQYVF